jgi:hypothetical protein
VSAAAVNAPPPPRFATGRRVTLDLENAEPRAALITVALADAGLLASTPPTGTPITVKLEDVPVEAAMDRVAFQLGLTWRRTFRLIPGTGPAPGSQLPVPGPRQQLSEPAAPPGGAPGSREPRQKLYSLTDPPGAEPAPDRGSASRRADIARALSDGLTRVMQLDPARRGAAIRQFALQVERGLGEVNGLPAQERAHHRAQIARIYQSGMRLYRGLTPDQQREFRPFFDVLRRWLNP